MRDPLIRRFISGSLFSAAFVWVAVYFFDVETDVVLVLFILSFVFVFALIIVGFLLTPLVRLFRSKPAMLSKIAEDERAMDKHVHTEKD